MPLPQTHLSVLWLSLPLPSVSGTSAYVYIHEETSRYPCCHSEHINIFPLLVTTGLSVQMETHCECCHNLSYRLYYGHLWHDYGPSAYPGRAALLSALSSLDSEASGWLPLCPHITGVRPISPDVSSSLDVSSAGSRLLSIWLLRLLHSAVPAAT